MLKYWKYILLLLLVTAVVLCLHRASSVDGWHRGDPELVIITPHSEAIRQEFERAFVAWYRQHYGHPVRVTWRVLDGAPAINRHLQARYLAAVRAWWRGAQRLWPEDLEDRIFDASLDVPAARLAALLRPCADVRRAFLRTDTPQAFSCGSDLFWGGGAFDHDDAACRGLTVSLERILAVVEQPDLLPKEMNGAPWSTLHFAGTALSTLGICCQVDRVHALGLPLPAQWDDLTRPEYAGRLCWADPTRDASAAQAFELIIQQQCRKAVHGADFTDDDINIYERIIATSPHGDGGVPQGVPLAYQRAIESGWQRGLALIQLLGANTRDVVATGERVVEQVDQGAVVAGLCADDGVRSCAGQRAASGGPSRLVFITPVGGSGVVSDPISLLRGAEHREVAERFIAFVLSSAGQRLWIYRSGTPGGPQQNALWHRPIRRDFYPADDAALQQHFEQHRALAALNLADPQLNAYVQATNFTYVARWTERHFSVQCALIKAMCLDSGRELRAAWDAILTHGGPAAQPAAMQMLGRLPDQPEVLSWASALNISRRYASSVYVRQWADCFRHNYREAEKLARKER